jgi:dimethylamine/trimethylamine dehydrogenase
MGGVIAELLSKEGFGVTLVTPAAVISAYTTNTMEQPLIQRRLLELGVKIVSGELLVAAVPDGLKTACLYTGRERLHSADSVILVTSRKAEDTLYRDLKSRGLPVNAIGDAWAPATIAHAVHAGRRFAEEFGSPPLEFTEVPFLRELTALPPC